MKSRKKLITTEQIAVTQALLQQFDRPNVEMVQGLELPTPRTKKEVRDDGAKTEDSLRGYAFLLECFKILDYANFSAKAEKAFDKTVQTIKELQEERAFLRTIHKAHDDLLTTQLYHKDDRETYPYSKQLQRYADEKYAQLRYNGEAFLIGAYNGHHVIVKLEQRGTEVYRTTYNAGSEALPSQKHDELVMGKCTQELFNPTEARVKDYIRTSAEKKLRRRDREDALSNNYHKLSDALDAFLGPTVAYTDVSPQHKSNCTTRSTREFLRDHLDTDTFQSVYHFVVDMSADDQKQLLTDHLIVLDQKLQTERDEQCRAERQQRQEQQHQNQREEKDAATYKERLSFLKRKSTFETPAQRKPSAQHNPTAKNWQDSLRQEAPKPVKQAAKTLSRTANKSNSMHHQLLCQVQQSHCR